MVIRTITNNMAFIGAIADMVRMSPRDPLSAALAATFQAQLVRSMRPGKLASPAQRVICWNIFVASRPIHVSK
jgi:hypothetical protein